MRRCHEADYKSFIFERQLKNEMNFTYDDFSRKEIES